MRPAPGNAFAPGRGGFATAVVLALAVLMVVFVISMQSVLFRVKAEVRRIEDRHAARQLPAQEQPVERAAPAEGGSR